MKSLKKVMAVLLAVIMCFAMVPRYAFSTEGNAYDVSGTDATSYNLNASLTIKQVGSDTYVPASEITRPNQGDEFRLSLLWNLPTGSTFTTEDSFVYSLQEQILVLDEVTNGVVYGDDHSTVYGTYTVSNNVVTVHYNDALLSLANKRSGITIDGTVNINVLPDGEGNQYSATIPGANEWNIQLRSNSGLSINKTSQTRVDATENKVYEDYTITLTALENNTGIILNDNLFYRDCGTYSNWYNRHQGTLTSSTPTATLNGVPYAIPGNPQGFEMHGPDGNNFTMLNLSGINLQEGDVLVINYSLLHSECYFATNTPYPDTVVNSTTVAESNETNQVTASTSDNIKNAWVYKSASTNGNNIIWTISVKLGEFSNLDVTDLPDRFATQATSDSTVVNVYRNSAKDTISGGTLIGTTTFAELKAGYNISRSDSDPEFVVLQYEMPATEGRIYTNNAKINSYPEKTASCIHSFGHVSTTSGSKSILRDENNEYCVEPLYPNAPITNDNYRKYLIKSELIMNVGNDAEAIGDDFFFWDQPTEQMSSRHHYPTNVSDCVDSIEVWNDATQSYEDASDLFTLEFSSDTSLLLDLTWQVPFLIFRFTDEPIAGQYRIVLNTIYEIPTNAFWSSASVSNKLYWKTSATNFTRTQWIEYSYLGNISLSVPSIHNDEIIWKVTANRTKEYFGSYHVTRDYTDNSFILDTLPAGLEFVAASWTNESPEVGDSGNVTPEITLKSNGTTELKFPIQSEGASLYIKTKYAGDYYSLDAEQTYSNNAKIVYVDENNITYVNSYGTPVSMYGGNNKTVDATIEPPVIADKSQTYNDDTAPYINYTVKLNLSEMDLVPDTEDEQTYYMEDTLGSALAFDDRTLLVNGEAITNYPELTLTIKDDGFRIDGFNDETAYVLTYSAIITKKAGTTVTVEETENEIDLPNIDVPAYSKTRTVYEGTVKSPRATAGGETASFRIHKLDDLNEVVPNAEFTVKKYNLIPTATSYTPGSVIEPTGTGVDLGTLITNEAGYTQFMELDYGYIYSISETGVPNGYIDETNGEEVFFVHKAWDSPSTGYSTSLIVMDADDLAFTYEAVNTRIPEPTSVTFSGSKSLVNYPASNVLRPVFSFTLSENDTVLETKTVNEQGEFSFSEISYDSECVHTYKIKEVVGGIAGIFYDTKEYTITVTVTDDHQGHYVATLSGGSTTGTDLDFTNEYKDGSLTVQKVLTGNDTDSEKVFNFTIALSDSTINETYSQVTFTNGVAQVALKGGESKTIYGLPSGVTYTVTEANYSNDGYTVKEKSGDQGAISNSAPSVATFTNERNTYGDLTVSKTVDGNAGDNDKEFSFTVTLSDTTVSGTYGDMTFNSGVATFTLKHGESKTANDLPNGVTYTVEETDYTNDGYTTEKTGETGVIVGGETKNSAFTNTRNAEGTLQVTKTLAGNDANVLTSFNFTVTLNQALNETFNGVTFTNGVANITLGKDETKVISGLPNGIGYTVTETNYSNDGYTTKVTKEGITTEARTISGTISELAEEAVVFTNERNTYGDLTVSKTVDGNACDTNKDFTFTVTLSDTTVNGTYGDMTFNAGVSTFTLKDGETKTATALPNGVTYTVAEADYSNDGYVTESVGTTGTIVGNEEKTSEFTNTRNAEGSLKVTKTLAGNDVDANKEFTFTVTLDDTTINETFSDVVFTNGVASIVLKGGEEKTISGLPNGIGYTVVEADYSNDGYTTKVTKGETTTETREATGTITEATVDVVAFTNERNTYGDLTVSKTVDGNAGDNDKQFSFTVTLSDTTVSGTYGDMTFNSGVATFTLKHGESKTANDLPNGVTYTVEETDYTNDGYTTEKTGETGVIVGGETKNSAFKNTRNAEGTLKVSKTLAGNDANVLTSFNFTVTLNQALNETFNGVTFTNGVANITLGKDETKVISGLPNGIGYTVVETDYSNDGYTTKVTKGETTSETREATGTITEATVDSVVFTNERNTYGDLKVSKTVDGNACDKDKQFSFTVTLSDNTIAGTYGDMTFNSGVATFTLKDGETKTANDLPNGVTYTVEETDYTNDGYVTESVGTTGTIVGNEEKTSEFTNTRNAEGTLQVTKTLAGNDANVLTSFNFTVTLNQALNETFNGVTFTNGVANITLGKDETKVISGLPNGIGYTVTETNYSNDGYTTKVTKEGITTEARTISGTITEATVDSVVFTNERNTYGDLTVSKTVDGNAGDNDKQFSFTVTLSEGLSGTYGDMTFNSGVATFTLKHGESKTANDLPNGVTYTVEETDYTNDGYTTEKTGETGTIVGGETKNSAFKNTRNAEGTLTVKKVLQGNDIDADKEFKLTITLSNTTVNGTFDGVTFTNGVAEVFLKGGMSKTITGLPNRTGYTVTEADYSNDGYELISTSTGVTGNIDENEAKVAEFTNERNTYGDLTVSKTVDGNAGDNDKEFTFTVTLSEGLSGTYGDMTFNSGVATFTLKHGESKTANDLPNGVTYTVEETDYTNDGYTTEKTGETGVIVGGETKEAAFKNTRNAEGTLIVKKELFGNDYDSDKEFKFTITLTDTTINSTFSEVLFTNGIANVYLKGGEEKTIEGLPNRMGYTVTEDDYSNEGYELVDTSGDITGTIDENEPKIAEFYNERNTYGNLVVKKTVTGKDGELDKEFEFIVTLSEALTGTYGEMEFADGIATFTLKDGEEIWAYDLPNGVEYEVIEADYTDDGYETTSVGETGTITDEEDSECEYTNFREVPNTGDELELTKWTFLTNISGLALLLIAFLKRKERKN